MVLKHVLVLHLKQPVVLGPLCALSLWWWGYILDQQPVHGRASTLTTLTCMHVLWEEAVPLLGQSPCRHRENRHTIHTERRELKVMPMTFLLWGDSTNHCTAVRPCFIALLHIHFLPLLLVHSGLQRVGFYSSCLFAKTGIHTTVYRRFTRKKQQHMHLVMMWSCQLAYFGYLLFVE